MPNINNSRIAVAFAFSVCVHIAVMGLYSRFMSGSELTTVDKRRVTITFAPRKIETLSPPVAVNEQLSALLDNTQQERRVAAAMIVPVPQETVEVLVREIPQPIKPAEEVKQETSRNVEKVLETTIQPESPTQTNKTTALDIEAATAIIREAKPLYKENPPPSYPSLARRRGYQGTVVLEVLVDKQGRASGQRIFQSSGYIMLDQAAENAVKTWRFEPGMKGAKNIDMWVRVPIRFQLR